MTHFILMRNFQLGGAVYILVLAKMVIITRSIKPTLHQTIKKIMTMDKVNFGLAKFLQFVVILFFIFVLAFYFGGLLLIPLAILTGVIDILTAIGFNGIFAFIVALPAVGWVCYTIYNIPNLFQALLDTGIKMYNFAKEQNVVFEGISGAMRPASKAEESSDTSANTEEGKDSDNPTIKPA